MKSNWILNWRFYNSMAEYLWFFLLKIILSIIILLSLFYYFMDVISFLKFDISLICVLLMYSWRLSTLLILKICQNIYLTSILLSMTSMPDIGSYFLISDCLQFYILHIYVCCFIILCLNLNYFFLQLICFIFQHLTIDLFIINCFAVPIIFSRITVHQRWRSKRQLQTSINMY